MPSRSKVCLVGRCDCSTSRMISSFSEAGYLIPGLPHPRSCFFEQAVFQGQVGHAFLESACLPAQVLDLVAGRRTHRITGQAAFAGLHELFRPGVIKALGNALASAQFSNAVLTAQSVEHNPDLVLGGKVPPRRTADILDHLLGGFLRLRGFRRHSRSFVLQTRPELSLNLKPNSVPRAL